MQTREARILRQMLISLMVFGAACVITQAANYERALARNVQPGVQQDYLALLVLCTPLIIALLYLSSRIKNGMEFAMTLFVVGLTGTIFAFAMTVLSRVGFRQGDVMALDGKSVFPFWAASTFLAAIVLGFFWSTRVMLTAVCRLPSLGKKAITKIRSVKQPPAPREEELVGR